jgi:uncharacterized MAPEG superfamily protein
MPTALAAHSLPLEIWFASLVVLFLKMYANSLVQIVARVTSKQFARPEDAAFFAKGAKAADKDHRVAELGSACWRNDLENIPAYLFLSLGFVLAGGSATATAAYAAIFCLARIGHTFFYLKQAQPHRTVAYMGGLFVCFALCVHTFVLFYT